MVQDEENDYVPVAKMDLMMMILENQCMISQLIKVCIALEYESQMSFVDTAIAEVMRQSEAFFEDNATSYIFTADHGMTDWGSHGDGSQDETETPFVAWGAGIAPTNLQRDINQADIAPLISTLLGISIPTNSEGLLPRFFLKKSNEEFGLIAVLNNIKQLIIQIRATRVLTTGDTPSLSQRREQELIASVHHIETLRRENKIIEALSEADSVMIKSKETLNYYRRLQRNQLIFYLTLLWIGWIALMILKLIGSQRQTLGALNNGILYLTVVNAIFCIVVILIVIEHKVSGRGDWRVLGYGIIAFFSVFLALRKAVTISVQFKTSKSFHSKIAIGSTILLIMSISVGVIDKRFFSIAMIVTALMQKKLMKNPHRFLLPSAVILAMYPLLPVPKPHTNLIMIFAPFIITPLFLPKPSKGLVALELIRVFLTGFIMSGVVDGRTGASWVILLSSPLSILLYPAEPEELKLTGVIFGLLCPLALLSASYEPQVFCLLGIHLISLLKTMKNGEEQLGIMKPRKRSLDLVDVITAVYFMLYILLSFFGTGNMASISSFDPMWTRHFITMFSPFTMTTLILLKIGIPLILIGCASRVVTSSSTFLAVLLLGDCLSLPLMYNVSSQGSWLDIGTTISRYTISITLPCLFMVLYYISSPLMLFRITRGWKVQTEKDHLI
ncbi:GPI ethanolamine phosphate transferase 1 [Diachasma alloeum]|uniref:GPI ethanolamine phosphate transferase 1 n=1 Tax=Diachasma alloeum TaxID=454923 RepID=UPI0010FB9CA3|nr:GPI ethanolamine phosphate transferase 1 [Diachasma alloeum]